jgi:hypothetical protein
MLINYDLTEIRKIFKERNVTDYWIEPHPLLDQNAPDRAFPGW